MIAEDNNIKVEVRPISIDEGIEAHSTGKLKEIFGSGTAVVVSEISSFGGLLLSQIKYHAKQIYYMVMKLLK